MTLLTIAQTVATNASIDPPDSVQTSDDDNIKLVQFINEAGQECARRVDWSNLRKGINVPGTGFDAPYDLPSDYMRLVRGMSVAVGMIAVRGGLSADEWFSIEQQMGTPRYYRMSGKTISFYPYPAETTTVRLQYISSSWVSGDKSEMSANEDTALIDENLIAKGAIWRFRRHIGADYQDQLAEFEAVLADTAAADGAERLP